VTSAGVPTLIATNVGDFLEGPTTVPNDPKYGPWAGTILVSSEQCGCVESVSNKGNVSVYGGYPSAEGVHVVPGGENFFGDDFADGKLVGIPASQLTSYAGDIFVATESPGNIIDVRWDSAANGGAGAFVQQPVINPVSQFEGTGFAPVGVANLPAPECSASSIVPQIHVTAGGVATTFEDKSRVLTHGGLDAEACGSRSATTTSQPTTTGFNAQPFATEFPESSGLGPIGLTFDRADNLLVTDPNNGQLYKFGPEGGVASSAQVGTGGVGGLLGIAFSKSGRLYGATSTNLGGAGSVVELDPATGSAIRTVVTGLANVDGLALDPLSGDLFASNASGGGITRISGFEGPGPISESSYAAGPYDGMVFGPDGTLFAAQYPTGIVKIAGTNQPQPAAVTNIASIPNADGIALFAPPPGQPVTRLAVNRNDGIITEVDTSATSTMLTNIVEGGTRGDFVTTGPDGCLYATQSNSVEKVTESNGACPFIPSSPTINESHDWVRIAGTSTVEHPLPPATTLTLSPAGDTEEIVGQSHTVKVAATNQAGHPLGAGVPVTLAISGANSQALTSNTEGKGIASFTYVGTKPGLDTLSATGFVAGLRTVSNAASLRWNILVPGGPSPTQSGPSPPFISTTAPTDGSMVSSPTPVTAVINPPANQTIASWEVTYENVSGGSVTKLASGTGTPPSPIATFNPTGLGAGTYAITVSATTNAGGKASALTHVIVGGQAGSGGASQTPPTVTKLEPADEAEVKRPTCVTASIDAPAGQSVASITVSVQAHSGGSPVLNLKRGNCTAAGQIAELDPTMLPNGTYTITVTATASGGGTQTATTTVAVTGNLKLGRYTTTYQDLSVPVNGFQMQVRRVYDSIDKRVGDFGVGWHVEVSSLHVSTNRALGAGGWSQYYTVCFFICHTGYKTSVPHYVTVTFPDNHQEVFDFTPGGGESLFNTATPAFTARPGTNTTSKLEDPTTSLLQYAFDGNLYVFNLFQATELYEPTRFKLTTHDGTVLVLDVNSGLVSETDRNGNSLTVDANGVRSSGGQSITFTRDSQSRITKITGPSGQTLGYGYGSGEDLSSFTDADGHETTYAYDPNHNLLKTTGPGGQPLQTLAYDGSGRLESVTDANGNTTKVSNNVSGRQQIETDPNGKLTTIYTYDELGDMLQRDQITEGKTLTTKYTYDSVGRPTGRTDPLGHTFSATYDESGDLTGFTPPSGHALSVTYNASGEPLTETNPLGKTTTFTYDSNGNLSSVTDQLEHAETYTYDGAGHVTALTNRDGKTTSYTYDSGGNLATETDPLGNTTHYSHDTSGNLTSVTDANDHTTSYVYDASGNLLSTTDPLGHTTTSTYDALNRPVSQTDPAGRTTHWTYTGAGQLASEEDPSKGITSYTYDADGNLVSSTDALGHTSHYAYDGLRQVTESVDRLGRATTYEYDRAGDQIATTDPAKHTTRLTYDGEGRLTSSADPLGKTSTYSYDAAGNQTGVKDPLGRETTYTYDAAGRKTAETDPAGHATEYAYDPNGLLTTLTDPLGGEVKFTYDADGNLIALTEADGNTTEYAYDAAGNLTKVTDPLKRTTTHTYNAANELATTTDGRKVTTTYGYDPDGELTSLEAGGQSVAYAYDSLGRRSSMTDATGTSKYTYDGVGNLTSVAAPTGTITYSYDAAQQRRTMTLPGSRQTTYGYDAASNLTSLKDWLGKTTMYSYDADGRQVGIGRPNGVNTTLSYDAAGQILSLNHDGMGGPIVHNSYTYDAAGNRASATTAAGTSKFGFDALNRLTSAAYPNGAAASYIYDAAGNRTSSTLNGKTTKATYDAAGELTSNGTTSYTYDGAGNLLTAGSSTFTWDPFGRLSNSTVGGTTTEYAYNGDGLRASAKTGSATTPYLWDTQGELPELVDDGANGYLQSEGIQEEVRRSTSAATFPLTEALGSVQALTNATGEVAGSTTYDAFGNVQSHAGTSSIFGFTGQQTDPTGLQYARARYLDPSLGRFISPDTVQPSGASSTGYNLYAYVGDNPTSAIDPSGNQTIIETAFQYLRANAATLALKGLGLCVAGAFSSLAIDLVLEEVKTHHYGGPQVGTALSGCAFNLIFGPVVCRVLSPVCRAIGGAVARVLGPIRRTIGGPIDRIISRLRGTTKGPSGPSPLRVQARPTVRNANGWLTDGNYTVRPGGNAAHLPGTSLPGKSVFYNAGNVDNLTLQAAEYADTYGLWNGAKAKVYVDGAPIGRTGSGQPTNWLNVYRDSNGIIHASPGNP
jgi:RHS repeat-associated protein